MNRKSAKRRLFAFSVIAVVFAALLVRLFCIQIIKSDYYTAEQKSRTAYSSPILAPRGNIYDSDMNLLATDVVCSRVYVQRNYVNDAAAVAELLSKKLSMSYDEIYANITKSETGEALIASEIDNQIALELEAAVQKSVDETKILNQSLPKAQQKGAPLYGIYTQQNRKRYYTDGTLAPYVLGFTNAEHNGAYGIEAEYNSVLRGIDGVESYITDAYSRRLASSAITKVEAIAGSDLVLNLNSMLQYYTSAAVYQAYLENSPKRVMAVVSDPSTNEILALSVYPGYDNNDAWSIPTAFSEAYSSELSGGSTGDAQLLMWKNMFTSLVYEPGSTFKVITTSSALEENIVTLASSFNCVGSLRVGGIQIKCHVYPAGHGSENLSMAVSNSCNPAMMQIAMQMGPDMFYKYIYNYGFSEKTGVDLDGEESGILSANSDVNLVDFVTLAFGQGLGVTPVQMLSGLNAAINGGKLLVPHVVKCVLDSESGDSTFFEPELVRRVISEETSATMRDILKLTADNNYALRDYSELQLGGKTGTAEKFENGAYAYGRYVASFYGFAPYDDPKLSVLVIVDEPSGTYTTGGMVAAPIGAQILRSCLSYLDSYTPQNTAETSADSVKIPDLRGTDASLAMDILDSLGIKYEISGDSAGIITYQSDAAVTYTANSVIRLTVTDNSAETFPMPSLLGLSVEKCSTLLKAMDVELKVSGGGICTAQSVEAGTPIKRGEIISATFSYIE